MKPTLRDHLVASLDRNTSIIVIRAYGPGCVSCGFAPRYWPGPYPQNLERQGGSVLMPPDQARQSGLIECGHLFGRTNHSARFDVHWGGNCYPQCPRCNARHNADKQPYFNWYWRTFGPVMFTALEQRWRRHTKLDDTELLTLAGYYRLVVAGAQPLPRRSFKPGLAFAPLNIVPPHLLTSGALQSEIAAFRESVEQGLPLKRRRVSFSSRRRITACNIGRVTQTQPRKRQLQTRRRSMNTATQTTKRTSKPKAKTTSASEKARRDAQSKASKGSTKKAATKAAAPDKLTSAVNYAEYVAQCKKENCAYLERAEWEREGSLSLDAYREKHGVGSKKKKAGSKAKTNGGGGGAVAMEDGDVTTFVNKRLEKDAEGKLGVTRLLKALRASGKSCEQGRFRKLVAPLVEKHRKAVAKK